MTLPCFEDLCRKIETNVGKLELSKFHNGKFMVYVHWMYTGGMLSGETKVAFVLRMLAGGSYLDLSYLFGFAISYSHIIFEQVLTEWFLDDRLLRINGIDYCKDEEQTNAVAQDFMSSSNGVIVKIIKPRLCDVVLNSASFYSWKGYHGINVQAIVDRNKLVLSRDIACRGAEHDSTAFKNSTLYSWLMQNWLLMNNRGLYFIGDSAHALKSFLITPFDNAVHGTPNDNYNFFHSSAWIVECTFGEIDLRRGILWKPLMFKLKMCVKIIDACTRLHNFIVLFRMAENADEELVIFDEQCC
ncbi:hypothetical protein ACHAXS_000570 [Conticribra weissflogii]